MIPVRGFSGSTVTVFVAADLPPRMDYRDVRCQESDVGLDGNARALVELRLVCPHHQCLECRSPLVTNSTNVHKVGIFCKEQGQGFWVVAIPSIVPHLFDLSDSRFVLGLREGLS